MFATRSNQCRVGEQTGAGMFTRPLPFLPARFGIARSPTRKASMLPVRSKLQLRALEHTGDGSISIPRMQLVSLARFQRLCA